MERTGTRRFSKTPFDLTDRQIEVIRLIERGYSNSEIATQLGISLDGAKFHVSEILAKLVVSSREEAVAVWKARPRRSLLASLPIRWMPILGASVVAALALFIVIAALHTDPNPEPESPAIDPTSVPPTLVAQPDAFTCPPPRTPTPTGRTPVPIPPMDGPGSVVFNGRRYAVVLGFAPRGMQPLDPSLVGRKFGEVCFDTSTTWPLDPTDDANRDGDAFHMSVGTELFTVAGYSSGFRLAAPSNGAYYLFEAMPNLGDLAGDVLDISGKVRTVNLYQDAQGVGREDLAASTSDPSVIERLVQNLLRARAERPPVDSSMNAYVRIQMVMEDGTETNFGFHSDALFLDQYHVPAVFGQEVLALLRE